MTTKNPETGARNAAKRYHAALKRIVEGGGRCTEHDDCPYCIAQEALDVDTDPHTHTYAEERAEDVARMLEKGEHHA